MRSMISLAIPAIALWAVIFEATAGCGPLIQSPAASTADDPKSYDSPQQVFDAYREANANGNYRSVFFCLTPAARDNALFRMYVSHRNNPQMTAVTKKYGIEMDEVSIKYHQQYKTKHGKQHKAVSLDGTELIQPSLSSPPIAPHQLVDKALYRDVVCAEVSDKAGFYDAAAKITKTSDDLPPVGKLQDLKVQGESAKGNANVTRIVYSLRTGKLKKELDTYLETFHFRKAEGGWLIEKKEIESSIPFIFPAPVEKAAVRPSKSDRLDD